MAATTTETTTTTKAVGDISSVFPSLSGKKPEPLPEQFKDLKLSILEGKEQVLQEAWDRLLPSLKAEVEECRTRGSDIIPSIQYSDIASGKIDPTTLNLIRHRGTVVIRNVLPRSTALDLKSSAQSYISANQPHVKGFPADDPAVYELYWSPSQVTARSDPCVLQTQRFLQSLWHSSSPDALISTTHPLTYADRLRIRRPGDAKFALGPHTDGGSLERWEDPEYSSVYRSILKGNWEKYDAFDAKHRIDANMDLYNGAGSCSTFRFFQGWLSMSDTGPGEGTLRVCPMLRHATAYTIMRPFFDLDTNLIKTGDDVDSAFPGSVKGAAQEYTTDWHPHLALEQTMVSMPKVEPGDYVAWHCDSIHSVDPQHNGKGDSSVMYIPTVPVTPKNVEYLIKQRKAATMFSPPGDFPGAGGKGERGFEGAVDWREVEVEGLKAMGMGRERWFVTEEMSEGEKRVIELANRACFAS